MHPRCCRCRGCATRQSSRAAACLFPQTCPGGCSTGRVCLRWALARAPPAWTALSRHPSAQVAVAPKSLILPKPSMSLTCADMCRRPDNAYITRIVLVFEMKVTPSSVSSKTKSSSQEQQQRSAPRHHQNPSAAVPGLQQALPASPPVPGRSACHCAALARHSACCCHPDAARAWQRSCPARLHVRHAAPKRLHDALVNDGAATRAAHAWHRPHAAQRTEVHVRSRL